MSSSNEIVNAYASPSEVLAASIVLPVLGIAAVGARLFARTKQKSFIGKDDATICLALLCVIGMGIIILYGNVKKVIGYPTPQLGNPDQSASSVSYEQLLSAQIGFVFWIPATLSLGLMRISVLLFYRRLFVVHSMSLFDIISRLLLWIVALWTLLFFFLFIFYCGLNFPITQHASGNHQSCISPVSLLIAFTISDFLLDLTIWFLPMPTIWRLRTSRTRKCLISGVFLLAASSLIIAVIRLVLQVEEFAPNQNNSNPHSPNQHGGGKSSTHGDINQIETLSYFWTLIQAGIAVIAACLPIIHTLFPISYLTSLFKRARTSLSYRPILLRSSTGMRSSNADVSLSSITTEGDRGVIRKDIEIAQHSSWI